MALSPSCVFTPPGLRRVLAFASPKGDDDGDGATEWASLAVQGQVRVMKDCLELKLRTATPPTNAATERLAHHAAWTLTTYQLDNEDLTAHQEIRGKTFDVQETVYDEAVWVQAPAGLRDT